MLAVLCLGCGPRVAEDAAGAAMDGESSGSSGTRPTASTGGSEVEPTPEEICEAWCGLTTDACFPEDRLGPCVPKCVELLRDEQRECIVEWSDAIGCGVEAGEPLERGCTTPQCEETYKRYDFCVGCCVHAAGWSCRNSVSGKGICGWSDSCYGHEFEASCPYIGDDRRCECLVDGEVMSRCAAHKVLTRDCDDSMVTFKTCCRDTFAAVLF